MNREATAGVVDDLSLAPVEALLHVLDDPHGAYPVIHVTGTNGKGSVSKIISALLIEHGLSVGTYTSPHLERVNERIARNLEPISDDEFGSLIGELADAATLAGVTPSYFELLTAGAFSWFAQQAVDVAVIEVGMLGRYDATNVVESQVAVVTNVGLDHTDGVGNWREAIAHEKAGIVKPGSFLILGETDPQLRPIFTEVSGDATWVLDEDFGADDERSALAGRVLGLWTPTGRIDDVFVPLFGSHQSTNAAIAVAAVEAFFARPLDPDVVRAGMHSVQVPGRFEVVHRQPLVVLDAAHNPPGAQAAAATLAEEFVVDGRRVLVVGLLEGRDPLQMLEALGARHADMVIACTPPSERAIDAEVVARAARTLPVAAEAVADVAAAIDRALESVGEPDAVLVTGSAYVIGPARTHLARRERAG